MAHECAFHGLPAFGFVGCYWDLKIRASRGEDLTDEEREFVGMKPNGHKPTGGWRYPGGLVQYEDDREEQLSTEDSAMLSALMNVPRQDQLKFVNADWF